MRGPDFTGRWEIRSSTSESEIFLQEARKVGRREKPRIFGFALPTADCELPTGIRVCAAACDWLRLGPVATGGVDSDDPDFHKEARREGGASIRGRAAAGSATSGLQTVAARDELRLTVHCMGTLAAALRAIRIFRSDARAQSVWRPSPAADCPGCLCRSICCVVKNPRLQDS